MKERIRIGLIRMFLGIVAFIDKTGSYVCVRHEELEEIRECSSDMTVEIQMHGNLSVAVRGMASVVPNMLYDIPRTEKLNFMVIQELAELHIAQELLRFNGFNIRATLEGVDEKLKELKEINELEGE